MSYHVIRTLSGYELSIAGILAHPTLFNLKTFCPTYSSSYVQNGRRVLVTGPRLRGYVFADWPTRDAHLWHAIRDITGVLGFIGAPYPTPISPKDWVLLSLLATADPDADLTADPAGNDQDVAAVAHVNHSLRLIQAYHTKRLPAPVHIISGPFTGMRGVVPTPAHASQPAPPNPAGGFPLPNVPVTQARLAGLIDVKIFGLLRRDVIVTLSIQSCEVQGQGQETSGHFCDAPAYAGGKGTAQRPPGYRNRGRRGGDSRQSSFYLRSTSAIA